MTFFIYSEPLSPSQRVNREQTGAWWDRAHSADQWSWHPHVSCALFVASSVDPYSSFDKFSSRATSNTYQSLQVPSDMQSQPQNRTTTRVLSSVLLKNLVKGVPFRRKKVRKSKTKKKTGVPGEKTSLLWKHKGKTKVKRCKNRCKAFRLTVDVRAELDARTCPVEVYFLPPRRRLGNRLGPSATTVLKVVEVAKTVAPSGAITHFEAWNAIVGTTTAWKATATRRMTARVFIVDDVQWEQDSIKRNDVFGHLAVCQSTFRSPFMRKDSSENHATHHLLVWLVTRHNVQERKLFLGYY